MGLGVFVFAGADEGVETVEEMGSGERGDDGIAGAAGNDGERDFSVAGFDVRDDFGNSGQFGKQFVIEILFTVSDEVDGHGEAVFLVERRNDFDYGHSAPGVKAAFFEVAIPFGEGALPGFVMERHGVNDGAVTIEEVGVEVAGREREFHKEDFLIVGET